MVKKSVHRCSMKKLLWRILWEKNLCRSFFFNKVSRLLTKERLTHRCAPVSFTKSFRTLFLQNTFGWLLLVNTFFCLLRRPQPQKLIPLTLIIVNIFKTNTVNCLQKALLWRSQTVSQLWISWFIPNIATHMSKILLEISSCLL